MKRIFLLSLLLIFLMAGPGFGQKRKGYGGQSRTNSFLRTQWWLGFTAGVNLTAASVAESYSSFSPVNYEKDQLDKSYEAMQLGGQTGLTVTFYHRGFSFVLEPGFRTQQFAYFNEYSWESDTENSLELRYDHRVNLQFIDVPFYLRYDLLQGKFRPYVQAGAYYSWMVNAKRTISTSGTDYASGDAGTFQSQEISLGADEQFKSSNYGIAVGAGTAYDIWNVRFVIGINYRHGLEMITNEETRFSANPYADTGDVMDDLTLNGWDATLSCVFPLRFISKNLKATE